MANPWTREFTLEFIELYRSQESVWKVSSRAYRDRRLKDLGYEALVAKMREMDKEADREKVVKKINSLRSTFRKEMKKIRKTEAAGSHHPPHVPRLWYFEHLAFLMDQETESRRNKRTSKDGGTEEEDDDETGSREGELSCGGDDDDWVDVQDHLSVHVSTSSSPHHSDYHDATPPSSPNHVHPSPQAPPLPLPPPSSSSSAAPPSHPHKRPLPSLSHAFSSQQPHQPITQRKKFKQNEGGGAAAAAGQGACHSVLSSLASDRLRRHAIGGGGGGHVEEEDFFDLMGKQVAAKLRCLPNEQRIFAEKLIHDVLFEAELGNLNRNYHVIAVTRTENPITNNEGGGGGEITNVAFILEKQ